MKFDKAQQVKNAMLLYAVTDRAWTGDNTLYQQVEQCLKGGVTLVQIREKGLSHEAFVEEAKDIVQLCHSYGVLCLINDDVQACLESGADGVHVGQDDMEAGDVRALLGEEKIIGVSAHSVAEAQLAQSRGADYLGVGAVHSTGTKTDAAPLTHQDISDICASVAIPCVAIGGIKLDNMLELAGTGVAGVAIVSGIFAAKDIQTATAALRARAEELVQA
ncbi:thiamine phosphate synthase [Butyricicoccus sp.]|uniref:thiamine phosphate synthase n=1 Tax=Butyricicoccus sp. TaxID=2049021 RepID=UPI003F166584